MRLRLTIIFSLFFLAAVPVSEQSNAELSTSFQVEKQLPPFHTIESPWVDSVFQSLTFKERIGQLFMIAAYSNKGASHVEQLKKKVEKYNIGGLIFYQGDPLHQAVYTNQLQETAKVPLLIAMDAEWGLGMRLKNTMDYPRQLMLGAIQNNRLIYEMGKDIARQCKRLGVHINFAPVIDVNNNPNNPVINDRSFGENKYNVTRKGLAYMHGLQDGGVLACAKHFPGHGDTDKDSHETLPVIGHSKARLDSIELFPFKRLIRAGVGGVMNAHLHIPAYDSSPHLPASLSKKVVDQLLKKRLDFKGLAFTDALNMKGVTKYFEPGAIEVKALQAGNDILLFPKDIDQAIQSIQKAVRQGRIKKTSINTRVKKILKLKYWNRLHHFQPIDTANLIRQLHRGENKMLKRKLIKNALTLTRNKNNLIPFKDLGMHTFASVGVGFSKRSPFSQTLDHYAYFNHFSISSKAGQERFNGLLQKVKSYSMVIVSIGNMSKYAHKDFGISPALRDFLYQLQHETNAIIVLFGSPYSLKFMKPHNWILTAYNDDPLTQQLAAQLLFGGTTAQGDLPVSSGKSFPYGTGQYTQGPIRLGYTIPEVVGLVSDSLNRIDEIAQKAIDTEATPGCQILIAKDGKVFFYKSYGHHTYNKIVPVQNEDLYDLASITKIASTTLSLMRLYDLGLLSLDAQIGHYLPILKNSNKVDLRIRDILTHQSGLKAWIPFYLHALKQHEKTGKVFSSKPSSTYSIKLGEDRYLNNSYRDTIWKAIIQSELGDSGKYVYSDLGFYLFKKLIEQAIHQPLDMYVHENFYRPLGLQTMGYNPLYRFDRERIVPTEQDEKFRKQLVHGRVHDPGAAMLGGVSGHAGVFSNANDLAVVMQMLLNKGRYGGDRYFASTTVQHFVAKQYQENRKGLGFDKPQTDTTKISPACPSASPATFGHSGFTGTAVWADPRYDLVYVFLSNRVHPDASNKKLIRLDIRTRIQEAVYHALRQCLPPEDLPAN